jgi:hypothetical protein
MLTDIDERALEAAARHLEGRDRLETRVVDVSALISLRG